MSARDDARRALLEAAILRELSAAADNTRESLSGEMEAGDRITVADLGYALVTKPRKTWRVVDHGAFAKWVETHAPEQIITVTQVSPGFMRRMCDVGEYVNADGEVLTPDGIGAVTGTPQLRIAPTDAAHELARSWLGANWKEIES
jgi:hypothetical protein